MICPECGKKSFKRDVCTNCGTVFEIRPFYEEKMDDGFEHDYLRKIQLNENIYNEYTDSLAPDFEYRHEYPKWGGGPELNRALKRQKKKRKKTNQYYYNRDYMEICRICSYLQLPSIIRKEALNIRFQIEKKNDLFFRKKFDYKIAACVKLACKIHGFPYNNKELLELIKGEPIIKRLNREYINLQKELNIYISRFPEHPLYISYICRKLDFSFEFETKCYLEYKKIKKFFESQYSLNGYILALIYLLGKQEYGTILADLENFGVSNTTISARSNEIRKLWGVIHERKKLPVLQKEAATA